MALEALLCVRSQPDRWWTGPELAKELRSAPDWMLRELQGMAGRGLVVRAPDDPESFRYGPVRPELARAVDELAALYAERRYTVIQLIFSPTQRPLQSFADAFRIRKEPPDG